MLNIFAHTKSHPNILIVDRIWPKIYSKIAAADILNFQK